MIVITKLNESFLHIIGEYDEILNISDYFSFYTPNYRWSPKYKAGVWDGRIRLFNRKTNTLPIGLYPRLKYFLKQSNINFKDTFTKTSIKFTEQNILDYCEKKLKLPLTPRDYQINGIIQSFKQQKLIIKSPTASGKSLILYIITKMFLDIKKEPVLIIVPTVSLVEQMKGDFLEYNENLKYDLSKEITTIYSGQERNWKNNIIISTWQSLQNITDMDIFRRPGCVLVDECFIKGTKVKTEKGYRNIESIKISDKVWTINEKTKEFELKKVDKLYKNLSKSKTLIKITLENDNIIKCTPNHKFLTTNRGWVKASKLTDIDELEEF